MLKCFFIGWKIASWLPRDLVKDYGETAQNCKRIYEFQKKLRVEATINLAS
jgi:hypothetical protein